MEKATNVAEALYDDRKRRAYGKAIRRKGEVARLLTSSAHRLSKVECAKLRHRWSAAKEGKNGDAGNIARCANYATLRTAIGKGHSRARASV